MNVFVVFNIETNNPFGKNTIKIYDTYSDNDDHLIELVSNDYKSAKSIKVKHKSVISDKCVIDISLNNL